VHQLAQYILFRCEFAVSITGDQGLAVQVFRSQTGRGKVRTRMWCTHTYFVAMLLRIGTQSSACSERCTCFNAALRCTVTSCEQDLQPSDILKAELIAALPPSEDSAAFAARWQDMEAALGRAELQSFLLDAAQLAAPPSSSSSVFLRAASGGSEFAALSSFTDALRKTPHALAQFGTVYLPRALDAFRIVTGAEAYSSSPAGGGSATQHRSSPTASTASVDADVNFALSALNLNAAQEWVPLAMRMVMLHGGNASALCQLLRAAERVAAYLTMCVPRSKTRADRYRAALEELSSIAADGGAVALLPPPSLRLSAEKVAAMRAVIVDPHLYQKKKCAQLVLRRLDMAMHDTPSCAVRSFDSVTVEHVLPQEPEARSEWLKHFDEAERLELTHALGNLVLLSGRKNSKAARLDFAEKKTKYFRDSDGGYSVPNFKLTQTVMAEERWTPDVVRRRQHELVKTLCGWKGWAL
jgi:hypothetical protein